jgi:hypothetical protein
MEDVAKLERMLAEPPIGFSVLEQTHGRLVLQHQTKGMGCMTLFLVVWLSGWGLGCIMMLRGYFEPVPREEAIPLFAVVLMWMAEIVVATFLLYFVFAKRTFQFEGRTLTFELDVFGLKRTHSIHRDDITSLLLDKDGGEGDDSFPSWGLAVEQTGKRKVHLLFRQRREVSTWLHEVIQAWRGEPSGGTLSV